MTAWLILSHTATLVVGAASGIAFVRSRPVREAITHEEHDVTETPRPKRRVQLAQVVHGKGPTPGALALFLILGFLVILGFAAQQSAFQQASAERDVCYEEWGQGVNDATNDRLAASKTKNKRLDRIIRVIREGRVSPSPDDAGKFDRAVNRYLAAAKVQDEVSEGNPELDCLPSETWLDKLLPGGPPDPMIRDLIEEVPDGIPSSTPDDR